MGEEVLLVGMVYIVESHIKNRLRGIQDGRLTLEVPI